MPTTSRSAGFKPKIMERKFRVQLRCPECASEDAVCISMADEPGDPATIHDFTDSGALDRIEHDCKRCGTDMSIVVRVDYLRTPEEGRSQD
ncbi:hypothetical protein MKK51_10065 [Methylobacterium sp. E-045]|nr:hypothetical protein [Methylobacterium sp. E-045]